MQTGIIKFHHTELLTAKYSNKVYVAMKPIIEGMGLAWQSQSDKIKSDERYNDIMIPYQTNGGTQEMLSLPTDQLAGFLYSINPNKVALHLREKIIAFQKETFNVINDYWNAKWSGIATDPMRLIAQTLETLVAQQTIMMKFLEQRSMTAEAFPHVDKPTSRLALRRLSNEEKFIAKTRKVLKECDGLSQGDLLRAVGRHKADKTALHWLHGYDGIYWRANIINNIRPTYSYSIIEEA